MKRLFVLILIVVAVLYGCSTNNTNKNRELNTIKAGTDNNSSKINKTQNNAVSKKPPVVLYRGLTLDKNDENVNIPEESDDALKNRLLAKYETDYYLYSDGNYLGNAKGKVEGVGLYCYWEVVFPEEENAAEIAISPNYNLYPRKINYINSKFPEELDNGGKVLSDINSQFKVESLLKELCYVDLDVTAKMNI